MLTWEYELSTFGENKIVCGTDEAGRGPLVGRVYAAAVVLDYNDRDNETILALNDSKKLSEKKRLELFPKIMQVAKSYCIAYSTVEEIENTNILAASLHAMRKAIDGLSLDRNLSDKDLEKMDIALVGGEKIKPDAVLVDGNVEKGFQIPAKAVVGGDGKSPSIAAASILAKVQRDLWCIEYLDKTYPEYSFALHKGYGTKAHYEALDKYGPCREHRMSFLRKYFEKKQNEQ